MKLLSEEVIENKVSEIQFWSLSVSPCLSLCLCLFLSLCLTLSLYSHPSPPPLATFPSRLSPFSPLFPLFHHFPLTSLSTHPFIHPLFFCSSLTSPSHSFLPSLWPLHALTPLYPLSPLSLPPLSPLSPLYQPFPLKLNKRLNIKWSASITLHIY